MNAPRRLLVATDFSENATFAVERAARLSGRPGCDLLLLHVTGQNTLAELAQMLHEPLAEAHARAQTAARHELHWLAARLAHDHNVYAESISATGPVAATIAGTAASRDCDLLVLGARGSNPVRDFLLGSTAERTLRRTDRSLLIVRDKPKGNYHQILVPTDFSPHAFHALQIALTLAPAATVIALHVFDAPFESKLEFAGVSAAEIANYRLQVRRQAEADMLNFLSGLSAADHVRVIPQIEAGDPAGTILDLAQRLEADLISVGKHGRSAVEEWVLGSVTLHVIQNAKCDVLAADWRSVEKS